MAVAKFDRIAVLDDEPEELKRLGGLLGDLGEQNVELFTGSGAFLAAAAREPRFALAFLDVYLADGSGVETAARLRDLSPETGLVFVTTSLDHAVAAFRLRAVHYLVKPVTLGDMAEALSRFRSQAVTERPSLTLRADRTDHRVFLDDIISLQSVRHAVEVTLRGGGCLRVWTPLSELEPMLDSTFLKLNRGTVVNMARVTRMEPNTCLMSDGSSFPISRPVRPAVRERYNEFLVRELNVMVKAGRGDRS